MAQVLIRQLDEQVVERLRQQAKQRGVSLEQSLRELLTKTAMAPQDLLNELAVLRQHTPESGRTLDVAALIEAERARR